MNPLLRDREWLQQFNAVEVDAVSSCGDRGCYEPCTPRCGCTWSVFLHYNPDHFGGDFGGCECVEDFASKQEALDYGKKLEQILVNAIGSKFIP